MWVQKLRKYDDNIVLHAHKGSLTMRTIKHPIQVAFIKLLKSFAIQCIVWVCRH